MIKVTKTSPPQILIDKAAEWTKDLLAKIAEIAQAEAQTSPDKHLIAKLKKEKEAIENQYNCPDIKQALKNSSTKNKCVFCECKPDESNFGEIEHFYPKSLYPEKTFDWDNLFWSCKRCNNPKLAYDTQNQPFLHPANDNPEDYFYYDNLRIKPVEGKDKITAAEETKEICRLNRRELTEARAKILLQFYDTEQDIKDILEELNKLKRNGDKFKRIERLYEKLIIQKSLSASSETYAGFLRYSLRESSIIQEAITKINEKYTELGLSNHFELY